MWCCSCSSSLLNSVLGFADSDTNLNPRSGILNSSSRSKNEQDISLDSAYLGHEVVVVKNGLRVCGTGGALGSAPLVQTKSYFEVKYQQDGIWGIGVATRNTSLDTGPLGGDPDSWILRHTGELYHNAMCIGRLELQLQEGDVLGVSYDHIELQFYVNGIKGNLSFSNVRGTVFPAVYVNEGAVLDVKFDGFSFPPPSGFDRILKEKSIL